MSALQQRLRYIATTGARRRVRDLVIRPSPPTREGRFERREDIARHYLKGDGIEIGASTWPLRMPPGARARIVDRLDRRGLIDAYGEDFAVANLDTGSVPETDVIDDASTLGTFPDASVDFVAANHVLEHMEDPLATLETFARVLRPGGIAFIALPDGRHSFDAQRPRTTVEHLLRDHREGPETSRREHYEEWARYIEGVPPERIAERADAFAREDARHHFHVWELDDFLALLRAAGLPLRLELGQNNGEEFVVVLSRTAD